MQQYFINRKTCVGSIEELDKDTLYHLIKVLRKNNKYIFRIVDSDKNVFYAHLINNYQCEITESLNENNELDTDITCILSLIKNDKMELCIQKLVELGVKRIVPYKSVRSVIKVKDNKKKERLEKIVKEAAEQSHRNIIPKVCDYADLKDLNKYLSEKNYICYESEKNIAEIEKSKSITYIIGPEGGFEDKEYQKICEMGFESVSLGKRILRAETAALYMTSIIVGKCQ
ncbi:MAG: RsmE family RNA methyltransferase [Erysipelotrichaceae bacterium]|nr:RsmE family RNA methyltransferase [Erysipelotrichaceae bacterium]